MLVLLGLNLGLLGTVVYLTQRVAITRPLPPRVQYVTNNVRPIIKQVHTVVTNTVMATNEFNWAQLESEDYRDYITRLRAIGCPEQTVRDIIIADIDKLMAPRRKAIAPDKPEPKYWEADDRELWTDVQQHEWQHQERAIDFEKRDLIQKLMGVDLVAERARAQGEPDRFGRRLGFLPDDKRNEVRKVIEEASAEEVTVREKVWATGEALDAEDQAQLKRIQSQQEQALARLLTPEERRQYDLWLSPTAYAVRDSLFSMSATEREFLALYDLKKAFDAQWPDGTPADTALRERWQQAQADLETQTRAQLGEQRYAEYQRANDPDFRQLSITAARFKLPFKVAADIYEIKRVVTAQRAAIEASDSLTPERKQATLAAIDEETARSVKSLLGDKAYNYYRKPGDGAWIRQ